MARKATNTPKAAPRKQRSARKEPAISRNQKPVFRIGTVITLILLAGLIALAFYLNKEKETAAGEETPTGQISFVFTEADGLPASIEIKPAAGETVKVSRNAENAWVIEQPFEAEADQGLAEAAATQVTSLRILDEIDADPTIFGFDTPGFVITVEFANGKKHVLEIGDITPTNSGYYVRVDDGKMLITSLSGIDSLLQLAAFPPYLYTPTPSPLPPTQTPILPTEAPVDPAITPVP